MCQGYKFQGIQGSKVPGLQDSRVVQGCPGLSRVLGSSVPGFQGSRVLIGIQGFKVPWSRVLGSRVPVLGWYCCSLPGQESFQCKVSTCQGKKLRRKSGRSVRQCQSGRQLQTQDQTRQGDSAPSQLVSSYCVLGLIMSRLRLQPPTFRGCAIACAPPEAMQSHKMHWKLVRLAQCSNRQNYGLSWTIHGKMSDNLQLPGGLQIPLARLKSIRKNMMRSSKVLHL